MEQNEGVAGKHHTAAGKKARQTNLLILTATAAVWLGLDQLTKEWALSALADGPNHVVGPLSFRLVFNSGSAFGINALSGLWLGLLAIAVVGLLFFYSRNLPSRAMTVLLGLVVGGALGNLADRIFRAGDGFMSGSVVDFIDLSRWPVFNLADSGIVAGAVGAAFIGSRMFAKDEKGETERSEAGGATRAEAGKAAGTKAGDAVKAEAGDVHHLLSPEQQRPEASNTTETEAGNAESSQS